MTQPTDRPREAAIAPGEDPLAKPSARFFHLLADLSREVGKYQETGPRLEAFLLTLLGSLGASGGFLWAGSSPADQGLWIDRGISPAKAETWGKAIPALIRDLQPPLPSPGSPPILFVRVLEDPSVPGAASPVGRVGLLLHWGVDRQVQGILGLGAKLQGEEYTLQDRELALGLVYNFLIQNEGSEVGPVERSSPQDLDEARQEIRQLQRQHQRLDTDHRWQVFYLKTLYDISSDLNAQPDAATMLEGFLLTVMGTFGFEQGFIQVFDQEANRSWKSYRGLGPRGPESLPSGELIGLARSPGLAGSLSSIKILSPSEGQRLAFFTAPFHKGLFFSFSLPQGLYGILGLGGRITAPEISRSEQELLPTLISHLLASLSKVNYSERVLGLNRDLEEKNTRLEQTLNELVISRSRIEILEKAKAQVLSVIRRELERTRRVAFADVLFILVLGALLGLIYNLANPGGIPVFPRSWVRDSIPGIAPTQAQARYAAGTVRFIDARPEHLYRRQRLAGAINLPLTLFDFVYLMKLAQVPQDQELVVYGRNFSRRYDQEVGLKLKSKGHTRITLLTGDLSEWRRSGLPLEP